MTTLADPTRASLELDVFFDAGDVPEEAADVCTEKLVHRYCLAAIKYQEQLDLHQVDQVELSVQIVERDAMQALNLQYRQKNSPTNILSFESGLPIMPLHGDLNQGGMLALGDLVLCRDVIVNEALEQSKSEVEHWAHMLVHGTLHLCGYDHEEPQQADIMESLEIQILSTAGIADPYGIRY